MVEKSLYIFSNGELKRKDNTLFFETTEGKKFIPITTVREIFLFGEVTFNSKVLDFLSQQQALVHYFNHYGYYSGTIYPRERIVSGDMILRQVEHYLDPTRRAAIAQRFVQGAAQNLRRVLKYYQGRGRDVADPLDKIEALLPLVSSYTDVSQLMAIEGNIREAYYQAFNSILSNADFRFEGRTKRPPRSPLNALISFGNSMLYTTVLSEIYKTHLDPRIGYLHATNFRRFTLNLDVAEIFKPILVDRIIFSMVDKGMLKASHFVKASEGIFLNDAGRGIFVKQWDERLQQTIQVRELGRSVSYRRLILRPAKRVGTLPAEQIRVLSQIDSLGIVQIGKASPRRESIHSVCSPLVRGGGMMFVIVVYDVHVKRVAKVLKTCRRYLYWVQNSVLEGEITKADFAALKRELAEIISPEHDSVLFYIFRTTRYTSRESIGIQKGGEERFL